MRLTFSGEKLAQIACAWRAPAVTIRARHASKRGEMVDGDALMVDGRAVEPDTFMDALAPVLPMAYRLARGFLRNGDEAEDVLQEATLKAWKHRGSLRAGSPLR